MDTAARNSRSLTVAIVTDAEPERNGVATYYRDLCDHLTPTLERIVIIGPGQRDQPLNHWLSFPLPGDATQRVGVPSPIQLSRRLREIGPDVVVIATPGPYGLLGAGVARRLGARVVFGLHTHFEALSGLYWGRIRGRLNRWYLASCNRRLARQCDHLIANSPEMCRLGRALGARSVSLVGTLLPREFIESPATDIGTSVRTVLYLGRLAAEKRIDSIIQAAEWLAHIQFRVAGDGPMRAPVERASRRLPNLEYLGWLARDDAMQALDAADILILPSEVEAFGTVALEALARGRVALVSETCGIRQWQSLRPNLFVISADESPAQAIARVTGVSGEALRRRSRQGRDAVRAAVSEALEEWLRVLAGNAPTSQRRDTA